MLLTVTTTHKPATDLGYLVHKNPFRCQAKKLPFGIVNIFYPEANEEKCTLAVLLDMDPVGLVRGKRNYHGRMPIEPYVNDRLYVCSSFMSIALSRVFGQTLNGRCKERPELVETPMPLTVKISVLPCRGGEGFLKRLFEPLGYRVDAQAHALDENFPDWGERGASGVSDKLISQRENTNYNLNIR
jgi:3' terminal RNA ribose 2'-O-methyltransferase Hen1